MPIRFITAEGDRFETDTPEEAVRIKQLLNGSPSEGHQRSARRPRHSVTVDADTEKTPGKPSLEGIGAKIVRALLGQSNGLTTDELAKAIGIDASKLPPMIRAVRKSLVDVNFKESDLSREKHNENGKPKSRYRLSQDAAKKLQALDLET